MLVKVLLNYIADELKKNYIAEASGIHIAYRYKIPNLLNVP